MSGPKKPTPPDAPPAAPAELDVSESSAPPPAATSPEDSTSSTESNEDATAPEADAGTAALEVSDPSEPRLAHVVDRDATAAAAEERKNAEWIEALEFERLGYERFGRDDRVAEVDAQLELARKRNTASSKPTTKR